MIPIARNADARTIKGAIACASILFTTLLSLLAGPSASTSCLRTANRAELRQLPRRRTIS